MTIPEGFDSMGDYDAFAYQSESDMREACDDYQDRDAFIESQSDEPGPLAPPEMFDCPFCVQGLVPESKLAELATLQSRVALVPGLVEALEDVLTAMCAENKPNEECYDRPSFEGEIIEGCDNQICKTLADARRVIGETK